MTDSRSPDPGLVTRLRAVATDVAWNGHHSHARTIREAADALDTALRERDALEQKVGRLIEAFNGRLENYQRAVVRAREAGDETDLILACHGANDWALATTELQTLLASPTPEDPS